MEADHLRNLISQNQQQLDRWRQSNPALVQQVDDLFSLLSDKQKRRGGQSAIRNRWRKVEKEASPENRQLVRNLHLLWERQLVLSRQLDSMAGARRLLAIWHAVHIPLGVAMFTVAFIHIGAALYYATLLR